jgi:YD repeat-containing protein
MKKIIVCFLLFFSQIAIAQVIDVSKKIFSDEAFLNAEIIKENKVKSMMVEIQSKADHKPIVHHNTWQAYDFDQQGRIIRSYKFFKKADYHFDTIVVSYEYDLQNRIATKRMSDNFGFYSLNYEYDSKGALVKEIYCRDISSGNGHLDFKLQKQYPIAVETFKTECYTTTQCKRFTLNNLGNAYKETLIYYDKKGNVISEETSYINTGKREKRSYNYDEKGRITEITDYTDVAGEQTLLISVDYDKQGRIIKYMAYKNNQLKDNAEFLFLENKPQIISAYINRKESEKQMDIYKITYTFWD